MPRALRKGRRRLQSASGYEICAHGYDSTSLTSVSSHCASSSDRCVHAAPAPRRPRPHLCGHPNVRQRELTERRAQRKVEEAREKTLKGMGLDPSAAAGNAAGGKRGGKDGSAVLHTDRL